MAESDPAANDPSEGNDDLRGVRTTEVFDISPDPDIPDSKIVKPHALIIDTHYGDINLSGKIKVVVDDTVLHDEDFAVPGSTGLRYEVHTPSTYHVHRSVEGWDTTHTVTVACNMTDGNASKTTFQILKEVVIASSEEHARCLQHPRASKRVGMMDEICMELNEREVSPPRELFQRQSPHRDNAKPPEALPPETNS